MSALPPKADIRRHDCDLCFVPKADILQPSFSRVLAFSRRNPLTVSENLKLIATSDGYERNTRTFTGADG